MTAWHWSDHHRGEGLKTAVRWGIGGALVLAAHAGAVYGGLTWHKVEAAAEPPAAVMLELAPLPVAPPSETQDVAPGPQMVQAPEPVPDAPDKPDAEPAPAAEPIPEKTEAEAPPVPPSPAPAEVVLPKAAPVPERRPEPEVPKRRETPRKKEAARSTKPLAPVTSAAPRSDAPPANTMAAPSAGASAASSSQRADWLSSVSAQLNRHKRYPPGAQGVAGRPVVRFTLDGSGRVTAVSLSRSSGSELLDGEAVATVRRASPFPPPPEGMGRPSLNVPINFMSGR